MSCINFSVVVYPLSLPSVSCTSRTVLAPRRHSTARMAISASVGSGGGSDSLEGVREAMRRVSYETIRSSTTLFVCPATALIHDRSPWGIVVAHRLGVFDLFEDPVHRLRVDRLHVNQRERFHHLQRGGLVALEMRGLQM